MLNYEDREFLSNLNKMYILLDLDKSGKTSSLELASVFKRNEYILCRPFRNEILNNLEQQ